MLGYSILMNEVYLEGCGVLTYSNQRCSIDIDDYGICITLVCPTAAVLAQPSALLAPAPAEVMLANLRPAALLALAPAAVMLAYPRRLLLHAIIRVIKRLCDLWKTSHVDPTMRRTPIVTSAVGC